MVKKRIAAVMTAVLLCAGLTGCAENVIPDMTDEQTKAVGEYVAITMMKYDANHRSRLVELPEATQKPEEPAATPEPTLEPGTTKEPSGMGPTDDTPVVDNTGNTHTMEEVLGLPEGVTVVYSGQEVCGSYPSGDSGEIFISLDAKTGKKLLALKFILLNAAEQEQKVDVMSSDANFRVTVNGDYTRSALKCYLPDDFSTFTGTIAGGSSTEAVILIEIDESMASDINSISLRVKNGEKIHTVPLL